MLDWQTSCRGEAMISKTKRSQSEIAGFVLIVVVVVIVGMVFLLISLRKTTTEVKSTEVDNLLSSMLAYTTGCTTSIEPISYRELISDCYSNEKCSNLGKMACDYLNESTKKIMADLIASEKFSAYELNIYYETGSDKTPILNQLHGNCIGSIIGAQKAISTSSGNLMISLKMCVG